MICKQCNKEFYPDISNSSKGYGLFCSRRCFFDYRKIAIASGEYKTKKKIYKFICLNCGKEFERCGHDKHNNKYCSHECSEASHTGKNHHKYKPKELVACVQCGKEMHRSPSFIKGNIWGNFCSHRCRGLWKSEHIVGEQSHQWNGGITPLHVKVRNCKKMREWVIAVFKKDNYSDWYSGLRGGDIVAHHITPFSKLMEGIKTFKEAMEFEPLWDVNNGCVMSISNHSAHHDMWGKQ